MRKQPQLRFSRFEYKYLISHTTADELMVYFSKKGNIDSYNINGEPYNVHSIYFDSPDFLFYKEKVAGYANRRKIRIRFYDEDYETDSSNIAFLEVKNKMWDKIFKERVPIGRNFLDYMENADFSGMMKSTDGNIKNDVIFWGHLYNLEPKVSVLYKRLSFLDKLVDCKVTFDFGLHAALPSGICRSKKSMSSVLDGYIIMELKFGSIVPSYVIDIIKEFNLDRVAISKYCAAVDAIYDTSQFSFT